MCVVGGVGELFVDGEVDVVGQVSLCVVSVVCECGPNGWADAFG